MTTRYRCRHCGSDEVEGTIPAWIDLKTFALTHTDDEADYEYGFCRSCEASGSFLDVVERVEP